ncbi:MAG: lactonase family protein [Burkholderiales bacterium]|nr:lactonase family protein [Burkholderiales bacterium]
MKIIMSPNGRFAYVANLDSNRISMYQANKTTGQLSPLSITHDIR